MDKKKVNTKYKKIKKELLRHNDLYFNKDKPSISDAVYDDLKKEALDLELKYPFLKKSDGVSQIVGAPILNKFQKIKHLKPMLSLSNSFEKKDILDFVKKINNFLNVKKKKLK